MSVTILREEGDLFGTPIFNYACGCGHTTDKYWQHDEHHAHREIEQHCIAVHLAELAEDGLGPCAECGKITDHLKMRAAGHEWIHVCELHAPADRLQAVLGT